MGQNGIHDLAGGGGDLVGRGHLKLELFDVGGECSPLDMEQDRWEGAGIENSNRADTPISHEGEADGFPGMAVKKAFAVLKKPADLSLIAGILKN